MRRRDFLKVIACSTAPLPLTARAQPSRTRPLIAWMSGQTRTLSSPFFGSFLKGMRDLGHVEGQNFDMLYRFSDGYGDRLPIIGEELAQIKPTIVLATAVDCVVAMRRFTSTIPIVSGALADAVHLGLIASEARPGGNVTGVQPYVPGLPAKQLELALEIAPSARKIGILTNLQDPKAPPQAQELEAAAKRSNVTIVAANVDRPEEIEAALRSLADQRPDVVIVLQTSTLFAGRNQIAASALEKRLPTVFGYSAHVAVGGLVSYGVDLIQCFYRTSYFVDKILRGAYPGDLPVEFPTKMLLSVNLKTASAIGVTVSPLILNRADEVIE